MPKYANGQKCFKFDIKEGKKMEKSPKISYKLLTQNENSYDLSKEKTMTNLSKEYISAYKKEIEAKKIIFSLNNKSVCTLLNKTIQVNLIIIYIKNKIFHNN